MSPKNSPIFYVVHTEGRLGVGLTLIWEFVI